ncbi:MAG TPA: phenylacetaldoxime dehydratase family protein [Streptosporangiaceae bacterium]|jgi:hypothetical protein|nr:phenylacetaldoxime dehydratase family protein [Streptosporangiaceae bacterium]
MESAIDQHLTCPRTLSRRVPEDYQPPFPMFVGRADPSVQQVVMAYLGVQCGTEDQRQDWKDTEAAERALYLDEIRPTLQAGMDFLRDNGAAVGCHSNRFAQSIDLDGNLLDESYNINCHPQTGMMPDAVAAEHLQPASG